MSRERTKAKPVRHRPTRWVIANLLEPDERILWQGQPIPRYALWSGFPGDNRFTRTVWIAVGLIVVQPFSLAGFYFAWVAQHAIFAPDSAAALAAGVAMLAVGLLLGLGPYYALLHHRIRSYRNAKDVHYVVTDRRTMILLVRGGELVDGRFRALGKILEPRTKMLRSNGAGDVIFDADGELDPEGGSSHYDVGFEGIANAEQSLAILREAVAGFARRREGEAAPGDS